ncbi:MAG TPA: GNAT family protein [Thermoanaerobaculia bacterium]|nr:GNAT family protein [Thermoanaerobaculia bacterium]
MTAPKPVPSVVSLRPARISDAPLFRGWRAEPSVRRHQPLRDIALSQIRADVAAQNMEDLYGSRGERFQWVIEVGREPAGWITLVVANWEHGLCELGFALSSQFQGRGIMPQALTQLVPELFLHTSLYRIEARCSVENVASQRVLEKTRFQREGRLRGYFILAGRRVDHYLYALLRDDYMA